MFVNAYLRCPHGQPYLSGNLVKSDKVYVEHFVPMSHGKVDLDNAEMRWTDKAYRLLYGAPVQ